jgi:hypothetical protein
MTDLKYIIDESSTARLVSEIDFLSVYGNEESGSTEFTLTARVNGTGSYGLATYSSLANLQAGLDAFIAQYPGWIQVGDIADFASASPQNVNYWVVAVQVALLTSMSDSGTGLLFNGTEYYGTFGYSPFTDYNAALAMFPLVGGTYQFTGS